MISWHGCALRSTPAAADTSFREKEGAMRTAFVPASIFESAYR
jgi:hypothetical protein